MTLCKPPPKAPNPPTAPKNLRLNPRSVPERNNRPHEREGAQRADANENDAIHVDGVLVSWRVDRHRLLRGGNRWCLEEW